jgi:GxxExxY protein
MEAGRVFRVVDGDTELTAEVIAGAIQVHRALGPGLLESVYQACLREELQDRGLALRSEVDVPLVYRGRRIASGYRVDLVIEEKLVVELKAVRRLDDLHVAQVLSYLRLLNLPIGLLINFHVVVLRHGIRRVVLDVPRSS